MRYTLFLVVSLVLVASMPYQVLAQDEIDKCFNYKRAGDYQRAIEYRKNAIEIHERYGNYHEIAKGMLNLGNTYRTIRDFKNAEEYLNEGLKRVLKIGDKHWEAFAYYYIGGFYRDKGEIQQARDYLTKAYNLFNSIGAKGDAQNILESLKKLDSNKGSVK